jgi:hypothetical protein
MSAMLVRITVVASTVLVTAVAQTAGPQPAGAAPAVVTARPAPSAPVTAIAGAAGHFCAVLGDHTVWCWGANSAGQLGNGTSVASSSPVPVWGITTAVAVTAGSGHSCALLADHTVRCWGANGDGQLGIGRPTANPWLAEPVRGVDSAVAVTAGGNHTCALLADRTVRCWGVTTRFLPSVPVATPVPGITTATSVDAGFNHTCAVLADLTVWCWGSNDWGQLGNGRAAGIGWLPPDYPGLSSMRLAISTGQADSAVPVRALVGPVAAVEAGGSDTTCAGLADHTVACWGYNRDGQAGPVQDRDIPAVPFSCPYRIFEPCLDGTTPYAGPYIRVKSPAAVPAAGGSIRLSASPPPPVPSWSDYSWAPWERPDPKSTCGVQSSGAVRCWGYGYAPEGEAVTGITAAVDVTSSSSETCALQLDHTVACWSWDDLVPMSVPAFAPATWCSATPASAAGATPTAEVTCDGARITVRGVASIATVANGTGVQVTVSGPGPPA